MQKIVLATRNRNKVVELAHALGHLPLQFVTAADFPEVPETIEDADTLEGNARKKAQELFEATGLPAIADDTGLEVDALGGNPGVYTARYAGEGCSYADNRAKMLRELSGKTNRKAQFRTVIVYRTAEGTRVFEGVCAGEITTEERGEKGFGYDPIFSPEGFEITFAEMALDVKNAISHRGKAVQQLIAHLQEGA